MKRISQNKFASSLFSCLGVAACVAFSSCGKKDNDQFKNANEFAEFLKSKAQNEQVTFKSDDLTKFANTNWKTASKKTFQFTEAIKKQIAGEDSDNENEELNPDQEQPNPGTEQPKPEQPKTEQSKPTTADPAQPKPATASPSGTTTISEESKLLSELIKTEEKKHTGVKIGTNYFDLNVFYDLYSWIYNKAENKTGLVDPAELTWANVQTIVTKSGFAKGHNDENEKKFGINNEVSKNWTEENKIYPYEFTASSGTEDAKKLECPCYNGLLKFWAQANDLGFSETSFTDGKLSNSCSHCGGSDAEDQKKKINSVATKLAEYLPKA